MWSPSSSCRPSSLLLFALHTLLLVSTFHIAKTRNLTEQIRPFNSSIPAIIVFGDSSVDSGNNNYIITAAKSNFPPYGRDFPNHVPTGRFTNGRLVTDMLASYAGIKELIPPYLDPTLSLDDLKTGVCFASAGTGFDPLTAQQSGVISVETQLKYFREYKTRLQLHIGKARTKSLMSNALFLLSAGSNDFILNYFGSVPSIRRQTYTISSYVDFVVQHAQRFLQDLVEMGARKIAVVGLPPIGCAPGVITSNSDNALKHRECIESLSSVAADYNQRLRNKLAAAAIQSHVGTKIAYVDIYKPVDDIIKNPRHFGFDEANVGCCWSGLIEVSFLCNPHSVVCSDDSKYVFWDAQHASEATYRIVFEAVLPTFNLLLKD